MTSHPTTGATAVSTHGETTKQELHALFEAQQTAFQKNMYPTYEERIQSLETFESMLNDCRKDAEEALSQDFYTHPPYLTDLLELNILRDGLRFIRANLKKWMRSQPMPLNRVISGECKGYVTYQPVGVVGNMAAWNAPFLISLGPLAYILAAGNRAIVKPSELAPACAEVLKEMVSRSFERDHVAVVTGEVDLAQAYVKLPWDHLVYTGNPQVGKLVMKAASENLTPVTLELGGKCPVIIAEDSVNGQTVSDIILHKTLNNGQVCITADYVFIPEGQQDAFVSLFQQTMPMMMPSYTDNPECTGIINDKHFDRLLSYLEDAEQKGARLVQPYVPAEPANRKERKVPFTLVLNPSDEMEVMKNEIFGPILPVKTYNSIDEAIAYVNSHERPLALYCYSRNKRLAKDVLGSTLSGGACINSISMHAAQSALPFGGIGNSGMGRYGGFEGFKTFSNQKSVYEKAASA